MKPPLATQTMEAATEIETLGARAALALERDIVSGALPPGSRLAVAELSERYQIGATPIREGLSRLVSRGLIVAIGQRGFRVAGVSRDDLVDITDTRAAIESAALRRSMAHGGVDWEADALAAFHRLRRHVGESRAGRLMRGDEFESLHKAFHTALIGGCGSPRMIALHSDLYDQAARYRALMMKKLRDPKGFLDEHEALLNLALARSDKATPRLVSHLRATLDIVYPDRTRTK